MDWFVVANIVLLCCLLIIGLPIAILCCWTLATDWNEIYVVKRHRMLVLVPIIGCCLIQFIYLVSVSIESIIFGIAKFVPQYGIHIIINPVTYLIAFMTVLRIWMLYYDINLYKYNLNKEYVKIQNKEATKGK